MHFGINELKEALEASWDEKTSYKAVFKNNNIALGQCYSTSRVIQLYFPDLEMIEGEVETGESVEKHFWNLSIENSVEHHIDLTWQQFPEKSVIKQWKVRDRNTLRDSEQTIARVNLLHERVKVYLSNEIGK